MGYRKIKFLRIIQVCAAALGATCLRASDDCPHSAGSGIDRLMDYVTVGITSDVPSKFNPGGRNTDTGIDRLIDDSTTGTAAACVNKSSRPHSQDGEDSGKDVATNPPAPVPTSTQDSIFARELQHFYLRSSVFDETGLASGQLTVIDLPAKVSYSHPGHGQDSYAVDGGAAYVADPFQPGGNDWFQIDLGVGAEYHRNSATASAKDLFETGAVFEAGIGNVMSWWLTTLVKGHVIYKNDHTNDFESINGGVDILPVTRYLRIDTEQDFGPVRWRWQPFAGLDYESTFDTDKAAERGHRVLLRYGLELLVYPLHSTSIGDSIEATAHATAFSALASTGVYRGSHWKGYFDGNLSYWFNAKAKNADHRTAQLGLGVSYQNGDDPESDLKKVDLLTLSLQAKY